jgi:hypothetical protein
MMVADMMVVGLDCICVIDPGVVGAPISESTDGCGLSTQWLDHETR